MIPLLAVACALVAVGAVHAAPISGEMSIIVASHCVDRGEDHYNGAALPIEPGLVVRSPERGFSLGFLGCIASANRSRAETGDHLDLSAGYERPLGRATMTVGGTFSHLPNDVNGRTFEITGEWAFDAPGSPGVLLAYDSGLLDAPGFEATGWYAAFSTEYVRPLGRVPVETALAIGFAANADRVGVQDVSATVAVRVPAGGLVLSPHVGCAYVPDRALNADAVEFWSGIAFVVPY